jgi:hypothetical protein
MPPKDIYVHPSVEALGADVADAISRLVPVRFKTCLNPAATLPGDILLSVSGDDRVLETIASTGVRYFHVTQARLTLEYAWERMVRFTNSNQVDETLRGRSIQHNALACLSKIDIRSGDEILAHYGDLPVWVLRRHGGKSGHIVSVPVPQLGAGEQVFDYMNGYHFMQLLPLLHFLRQLTGELSWTLPPVRACIMFDDPNLHWPSYGFLSYRKVIEQAVRDRFHVAIATVPLDAWGLHSSTIKLLKVNSRYVSLLIHGNDHTHCELGQPRSADECLRVLAQSLRRIDKLERVSGLHVDRVMVPPHEALSRGMLNSMSAMGFEGICLAPWSLRHWNPKRNWPPTFGLETADMASKACPIVARYALSERCEGPVVICAFLGCPIVLSEHHNAVANGLGLLSAAAAVVNSLGDVHWCGVEEMLRSNYTWRRDGATARIRPYSARFALHVPQGISTVSMERCDDSDETSDGTHTWICVRRHTGKGDNAVESGTSFDVVPGDTVELILRKSGTVDYRLVHPPKFSAWAVGRRLLCEGRDRLSVLKLGRRLA